MVISVQNIDELPGVARQLIESFPGKRVFAFQGPMGSGKTTFIKTICRELGVEDLVNSPSFPIVNHYVNKQNEDIYHFDFYRIKTPGEAYDMGYEDYLYSGSYCLIEWPEKISSLLPPDAVTVNIEEAGGRRTISF